MQLRAIWVLSLPSSAKDRRLELLFARRFPTVEKKFRLAAGESYTPLPSNQEIAEAIYWMLSLKGRTDKFVPDRDGCGLVEQRPILELSTPRGPVWPVLVVEQGGLLYGCLPLTECSSSKERPALIDILGLSVGFSLMVGMAAYLSPVPNFLDQNWSRLQELNDFLSEAAPFGSVRDSNISSVLPKLQGKAAWNAIPKTQQPSWKPVLHKGKGQLHLVVTEQVRCVQFGRKDAADALELYGTVWCHAELEGNQTDITLNVAPLADSLALPLDYLLTHPCVQSAEAYPIDRDSTQNIRAIPRRLRFCPPPETFPLCHYTVSTVREPPIWAEYTMVADGASVQVELRLKLNDHVKNAFEYCEAQMPFYNRGTIRNFEGSPSVGSMLLSPDRRILVWNIGTKFPTRTLDATSLTTVHFESSKTSAGFEDSFCVGPNAYAQLYFKIADFTHSGCHIDTKSVQLLPSSKFKLTTACEYLSADYKIWNTEGDAPVPYSSLQSS